MLNNNRFMRGSFTDVTDLLFGYRSYLLLAQVVDGCIGAERAGSRTEDPLPKLLTSSEGQRLVWQICDTILADKDGVADLPAFAEWNLLN